MVKNKKDNNNKINIIIILGMVILIGSLVLMFVNSNKTENHIKKINYSEYKEIIQSDKYAIILLTNPSCIHCNNYRPVVNYVAVENNLYVYDLDVTELTAEEYIELHDRYTATKDDYSESIPVIRTPATIIVKNNEEVTSILGDIGYNGFLKLLKNNNIIK